MKTLKLIVLLGNFLFAIVNLNSQCYTDVDFHSWTKEGGPLGKWDVMVTGDSVTQKYNTDLPTFFVSPFDIKIVDFIHKKI